MYYLKNPKELIGLFVAVAMLGIVVRFADLATTFRVMPAEAVVEKGHHDDSGHAAASGHMDKAKDHGDHSTSHGDETHAAKPSKTSAMPFDDPMHRTYTPQEISVLQALASRRDDLVKREEALVQREALLKAAEKEVSKKVVELEKLKADMERLLGQQQKAEQDRIQSLVKIYENMKPAEAARIFDTLEINILLDVIGRMKERKVSPVLAKMNPDVAKDVTMKLAKQKRLPGDISSSSD